MAIKHNAKNGAAVAGAAPPSAIFACPYCEKTTEDKDHLTKEAAVIATCYAATKSKVVQCNWCGLSGPIFETMDEAIEAWNSLLRKSPEHPRPVTVGCAAPHDSELDRELMQLLAIQPKKIREMLVKHGLVDFRAVEDPEGFNNYLTLDAVNAFALELHHALFTKSSPAAAHENRFTHDSRQ